MFGSRTRTVTTNAQTQMTTTTEAHIESQTSLQTEMHERTEATNQASGARLFEDNHDGINIAAVARNLVEHDDGNAAPPNAMPTEVRAEERANVMKAEHAQQNQFERERVQPVRRSPEEIARLQEEFRIENIRQENREQLFGNPTFVQDLTSILRERDPQRKTAFMRTFMHTAANVCFEQNPDIKAQYTQNNGIALQCVNMKHLVDLFNPPNVDAIAEQLQGLKESNEAYLTGKAQHAVLSTFLKNVLKEEFLANPGMNELLEQMGEQVRAQGAAINEALRDITTQIETSLGINVLTAFNETTQGYFWGAQFEEQLQRDIQAERGTGENAISEREAEKRVFARYRAQKKAEADRASAGSDIVPTATEAEKERYGSALKKRVVPYEVGAKIVASSHQCIYMKPAGSGLVELRPTIPKKVTIDGKEYPLRKDYNTFIKSYILSLFTPDGELKPDADRIADEFEYELTNRSTMISYSDHLTLGDRLANAFTGPIADEVNVITESAEDAQALISRMKTYLSYTAVDYFDTCKSGGILPAEILTNTTAFIMSHNRIIRAVEHFPHIKEVLLKKGKSEDFVQAYKETLIRMKNESIEKVREFFEVGQQIDVNSEEVPLPQACSANGIFYHELSGLFSSEKIPSMVYKIEMYYEDKPEKMLEAMEIELRKLKEQKVDCKDLERKVSAIHKDMNRKRQPNEPVFSNTSMQMMMDFSASRVKYDYHVAGKVGEKDGEAYTVEMFAAETTTFAVTPYGFHGAIGVYKGGINGMRGYYNADNAIATEEEDQVAVTVNQNVKNNQIPGIYFGGNYEAIYSDR